MGYAVSIMVLERVIEITETCKQKAVERLMKEPGDEDLQLYRDYQYSLAFYLEELKKVKGP